MTSNSTKSLSASHASKRYFALLASVMLLIVIGPLVQDHLLGRFVLGFLSILSLAIATLAAQLGKKWNIVVVVLAALTAVAWGGSILGGPLVAAAVHLRGTAYLMTLAFITVIALIMMKDIFTNEVTGNRVAGAICVYILIGFCFAIIHMLVLLYVPGSYKDSSEDQISQTTQTNQTNQTNQIGHHLTAQKIFPVFVYYSFCTISTVGYGDIVPVGGLARTMSWLEAVGGQIYLTVLVARLVGLHIASGKEATKEK